MPVAVVAVGGREGAEVGVELRQMVVVLGWEREMVAGVAGSVSVSGYVEVVMGMVKGSKACVVVA